MKKTVILSISAILCLAVSFFPFNFSSDKTLDLLLKDVVGRVFFTVFLLFFSIYYYPTKISLKFKRPSFNNLLWLIPCFLCVLVNFPFSALITKTATVEITSLIPLFVLDCILIGTIEELFFRLIIHEKIKQVFREVKNGYIYSVAISSGIFAISHLTNLLFGAGFGATALQVGYTFLTGAMFAVIYDKTSNISFSILFHAVFDVGGNLITTLGKGRPQDRIFWILTVSVGILTFFHVFVTLLKTNSRS